MGTAVKKRIEDRSETFLARRCQTQFASIALKSRSVFSFQDPQRPIEASNRATPSQNSLISYKRAANPTFDGTLLELNVIWDV
jgi:hypothetical protein